MTISDCEPGRSGRRARPSTRPLLVLLLALPVSMALPAAGAEPVAVAVAREQAVAGDVPVAGSVVARHHAILSTAVAGRVDQLETDIGETVAVGATLLRLDAALARHELAAAEASADAANARLEDATRRLQEVERLRAEQVVARTEVLTRTFAVEEARAEHARWQAEVAQRREWLLRHQLRAPFAGVIVERHADPGEWVDPGDPVFDLVATEAPWVDLQVPQQYFRVLSTGSAVRLQFDAFPGTELPGRITRIVPVSGSHARTFRVRVTPGAGSIRIAPGMSVRGLLQLPAGEDGTLVPRDALVRKPDGTSQVWRVDAPGGETRVEAVAVRPGAAQDGWILVRGELRAGDRVVVRGNESLQSGQAVRIVDAAQ